MIFWSCGSLRRVLLIFLLRAITYPLIELGVFTEYLPVWISSSIIFQEAQRCHKCVNAVNDSGLGNSITMNSRLDSPVTTHNGIRRRPNRIPAKGRQFSLVKGKSVEVAPKTDINRELNTPERDTSSSSWFNVGIKLMVYIVSVVLVVSFFSTNLLPLPKFVVTISYAKVPPIWIFMCI